MASHRFHTQARDRLEWATHPTRLLDDEIGVFRTLADVLADERADNVDLVAFLSGPFQSALGERGSQPHATEFFDDILWRHGFGMNQLTRETQDSDRHCFAIYNSMAKLVSPQTVIVLAEIRRAKQIFRSGWQREWNEKSGSCTQFPTQARTRHEWATGQMNWETKPHFS
jgi:hypothetical protein